MNPISKITIKGFKSIQLLQDFELTHLNVVVGANGAGKSNLVSFFKMLRMIRDGYLGRYVRDGGGMADMMFGGPKITQTIQFQVVLGELHCALDVARKPDNTPDIEAETNYVALSTTVSAWQVYHFHDTGSTAGMRNYEIVEDDVALRGDAANIAPFLRKLKQQHPDCYKNIVDVLGSVIPFFDDFILEPRQEGPRQVVNLSWKQKDSDYPFQPYHLSDGSIRFICLAVALLQPKLPSLVVMDEPELGLHPAAVAVLADLIEAASMQTQVIVATQSPELLNYFAVDNIVVVKRQNGASVFERLKEDDFKEWLKDYSVGELWTKNVIAAGLTYE